ncbi:MAG: hypothetical protein HN457_15860 [Opitutales bacterium]|nr:hypothetical protein [Opitutales bacterium]MBT5815144.1 hypothetical protein [Opitutales bacterium]MBT6381147.1 hypothetical protein [Opitutales bacterium]
MTLLDKLERKFGGWAISNIAAYIVGGQVVIWLLSRNFRELDRSNAFLERMLFDPEKVLQGDVLRVFAFPLIPPASDSIFLIFVWYIFYMMASALESQWGAFRLNVYLFVGAVLGMAGGLLLSGLPLSGEGLSNSVWGMTVFFAFAYLFPDFELRLFFILPVKVRWLGWIMWAMPGLMFVASPWQGKVFVAASVGNFFIFFGKDILTRAKSKKRLANLKSEKVKQMAEPFHACSRCGATDKSHPEREFRYRSNECICDRCLAAESSVEPQ